MKIRLTSDEIRDAFLHSNLEENYNFLEDDLFKLADAFLDKAEPLIRKDERSACVDIAYSLNSQVARKIEEVRGNAKAN